MSIEYVVVSQSMEVSRKSKKRREACQKNIEANLNKFLKAKAEII